MRHLKLFLISIFSFLSVCNSYAKIVDGIRQRPELSSSVLKGFTTSSDFDQIYYLYNIKAKAFYCNGNAYGTQSSISTDYGLGVVFLNDDEYSAMVTDYLGNTALCTTYGGTTIKTVDFKAGLSHNFKHLKDIYLNDKQKG